MYQSVLEDEIEEAAPVSDAVCHESGIFHLPQTIGTTAVVDPKTEPQCRGACMDLELIDSTLMYVVYCKEIACAIRNLLYVLYERGERDDTCDANLRKLEELQDQSAIASVRLTRIFYQGCMRYLMEAKSDFKSDGVSRTKLQFELTKKEYEDLCSSCVSSDPAQSWRVLLNLQGKEFDGTINLSIHPIPENSGEIRSRIAGVLVTMEHEVKNAVHLAKAKGLSLKDYPMNYGSSLHTQPSLGVLVAMLSSHEGRAEAEKIIGKFVFPLDEEIVKTLSYFITMHTQEHPGEFLSTAA